MVHNGIEYGDMQLICEAYQLMKDGLGMTAAEMQQVFADWNKTELDSYLIEITATFWLSRTPTASRWWTKFSTPPARKARANGRSSVQPIGHPITLIAEAVYSRCVSALKRSAWRRPRN
jgi:6-phosphogluconate dehydrogenase